MTRQMRTLQLLFLATLVVLPACGQPAAPKTARDPGILVGALEHEGLLLSLRMAHAVPPVDHDPATFRAGEDVRFSFRIEDATGAAVSRAFPAAWMVRANPSRPDSRTELLRKTETLVSGSLFARADLDLNIYYVVTMNHDKTLSVVDPRFGFGGSRTLTHTDLEARAVDWAMTKDQSRIYVACEGIPRIDVLHTATWTLEQGLALADPPTRLVLQPDERYLWVSAGSAVHQIDTCGFAGLACRKRIEAGPGPHDIVVDAENRYAFLLRRAAHRVSIVEVAQPENTIELPVSHARHIAYSDLARVAVVTTQDGGVFLVDRAHEMAQKVAATAPGLDAVRFDPTGRYAFLVNPETDQVHIFDVASRRVIQTAKTRDEPDDVSFTDSVAYVRHRKSPAVLMIPFNQLAPSREASLAEFPGGQNAPGAMEHRTPAPSIVRAPGTNAVLVANPKDRAVYFYKEGMASPMGSFNTAGGRPRALCVVDRSLRERGEAGTYETTGRLPGPGTYDIIVFLDAPRIIHRFSVAVAPDPNAVRIAPPACITPKAPAGDITAQAPTEVRFLLRDPETDAPQGDAPDVIFLVRDTASSWQMRGRATQVGLGVYSFAFVPPRAGRYGWSLDAPSLRLSVNRGPEHYLNVIEPTTERDG